MMQSWASMQDSKLLFGFWPALPKTTTSKMPGIKNIESLSSTFYYALSEKQS